MITGKNIRQTRKEIGLTQEMFAERTGFSPRMISRFENDENMGKINKYFKLFSCLGWTQDDIKEGNDKDV